MDQECEPRQSNSRTYVSIIYTEMSNIWASQMVQWVKNLPANARDEEDEVQSLGQEDLLEEEMVTHSSILAWTIPWTEERGGLQSMRSQKVRHY